MGRPSDALMTDPKFKGEYGAVSKGVGEELALATLTSEYFVLALAKVPHKDRYQSTQYPRLVDKPVTAPKTKDTKIH